MMKRTIAAKKSPKRATRSPRSLASWTPEGATILSTMEFLTTNAESPASDDEDGAESDSTPTAANREEAIEYLCQRLSLPRIQTLLVTYLLYHTARYPRVSCDMEDLSNMMRVHPLRNYLYIKKGLIYLLTPCLVLLVASNVGEAELLSVLSSIK